MFKFKKKETKIEKKEVNKNLVDSKKIVEEYLHKSNWRLKENANMGYAVQWLNNYISSKVSAKYWLDQYPEPIADAHRNWDLHLHDLAMVGNYCCWWDLKDLLLRWFWGVPEKHHSKPPKHLRSALGQLVNFLYTLQGEANWAQAVASFDTFLAPFVRYDWLEYKQVKQALQEFVFNMNVPTRVWFQTPFSNITLDVVPSEELWEQNVIIGWEIKNEKYKDFQKEMDMINKALWQVFLEWDAKWRPFSFPIPTYNIDKEFPWDKECLDPIIKATWKYWIPYFANFISTWKDKSETRSMCPMNWSTVVTIKTKDWVKDMTLKSLNKSAREFSVWNWKWVKAKAVEVEDNNDFYKVSLRNWKSYEMTWEHLNIVQRKWSVIELKWEELMVWDKLPYSFIDEQFTGRGSYDLWKLLWLYLAEWSHLWGDIQFSLSETETDIAEFILDTCSKYFAANGWVQPNKWKSITVMINSDIFRSFIDKFVEWKAINKKLKSYFWFSSEMFRWIYEWWMMWDWKKNWAEAYSSSKTLIEQMSYIASKIWMLTNIRSYDRTTKFWDKEYESTIYTLHVCNQKTWKIYKESKWMLWTDIVSIERTKNKSWKAYCVEVKEWEPLFMLADWLLTHNCRLSLDMKEIKKRWGWLFWADPLTGSIWVVTLNMPRIWYLAKNEEDYIQRVYKLMDLAKESLEIKRNMLEKYMDNWLYPYSKHYIEWIKSRFGKYWANHFSTIWINGMNESLINFFWKDITSDEWIEFTMKVMNLMNERLRQYQDETGNLFNLEASPAEWASYRFALSDKEKYPKIICANEPAYRKWAKPYYTNSTHVNVDYTDDLFTLLDKQSDIQSLYSGWTVIHIFLWSKVDDVEVIKKLIKTIFTKYKVPYISITPTFSICEKHWYLEWEHLYCPKCAVEDWQE